MNEPLFSVDVARIVERKQADGVRELVAEARPLADGWMVFGGQGSYMNWACGFGWDRKVLDPELDELVGFFTDRGVEPKVKLSAFADPALLAALADRGFVLREFENVLARSVEGGLQLPHGMPKGVVIERVDPDDEALVRTYIEVSGSGFLGPGESLPESHVEFGLKAAREPTYDCFVARVDGKVVGAGGCESSGGATVLFGTSVLPNFRGRGIQQALIAARVEKAKERGNSIAAIISRPGIPTERNAARLGFGMMYSRVVLVKHGEGLVPSP